MTTVYTIKNNGVECQTDDIDEVKEMKKQDAAIKAKHHVETVKQTEADKGVLVMSDEPDWVESDPVIMADANAWVFTEGME